jgi:hypothetical protein
MLDLRFEFDAELTDEQSLLNGKRSVSIEGEATHDGDPWFLSLTFERPKSPSGPIVEGDLTLTAQAGIVVAGLESGRVDMVIDDILGDERDVMELVFRPLGQDGALEGLAGRIELSGELAGGRAMLRIRLQLAGALEAG